MKNSQPFNLTYLKSFKIKNKKAGLTEPSGLSLSFDRNSLWTISDDTKKIFKLNLDGSLIKNCSFKISDKELEGIALDPTGNFLLTVKESSNEIIKIKIDTQDIIDRERLSEMSGYNNIAHFFSNSVANKGLEGITYHLGKQSIFVIKEGHPGLLIEVSADLKSILSHCVLNHDNGFIDDKLDSNDIDFSDISYDPNLDCFWIISDKARCLFLYDAKNNTVIQKTDLSYTKNGKYKEIKKAEGVAIDPNLNRLYVASDEEARLYIFDIRFNTNAI